MTSVLARRLEKLEAARKAREPRKSLVLCGTEGDVERRYQEALADGRYRPGDPLMRIILKVPAMNAEGRAFP